MNTNGVLLAKKHKGNNPVSRPSTLIGHCELALSAAETIIETLGEKIATTLHITDQNDINQLYCIIKAASLGHDLGKASDHFQKMLSGKIDRQGIRHEAVSYFLLEAMLSGGSLNIIKQILWSVIAHHRKYPDSVDRRGCGVKVRLFSENADFGKLITRLKAILPNGVTLKPELPREISLIGRNAAINRLNRDNTLASVEIKNWPDHEKTILAACKASVISADIAASASINGNIGWIDGDLRNNLETKDFTAIIDARLSGKKPREFQTRLQSSGNRITCAVAGCGTGKTLGAYLWARNHAIGKRLFFCYPTTGTSTEGYRDYLMDPAIDARLQHGRAAVDIKILGLDDPEDEMDAVEAAMRWRTKITSCTVDLVLGLLQNSRSSVYAWPLIANGAFVFDEIHSYDDTLFGYLLRFLEIMRGAPCLLMSASIPRERHQALVDCAGRCNETIMFIDGPADLETIPRYVWKESDPAAEAHDALSKGMKVLWVNNTVGRCIKTADSFASCNPIVYHSAFRYGDRVKNHGKLINAFKNQGPALAIATQVAEMSLDIDADILVTDLAPIPALIQRLGRLNRRALPGNSITRPFITVNPDNSLPYLNVDIDKAKQWLKVLSAGNPLTQRDLTTVWESLCTAETPPIPGRSEWYDSAMTCRAAPVREAQAKINVVLYSDANDIKKGIIQIEEACIPMSVPWKLPWKTWDRLGYCFIAPVDSIDYSSERGARWKK